MTRATPVLIIGGSGQLGTAFQRLLPDATFPARRELDLSRPNEIRPYLESLGPTGIINCAAYTNVDGAETDEDLATVVNSESVGVMATYASEAKIPFVTFSTDYVFDGTASQPYLESDPTRPINAYGRSKLAGERLALEAGPSSLVVRTSWVISGTHPNFVATMLRLARERDRLGVVADQRGCPTIVDDLAVTALDALDRGVSGLLHLTNSGQTTWFHLAQAAIGLAGLDPEIVEPITTSEFPTPAPRPAYSVLGSERLEALGLDPLPPWEQSLAEVVAALEATA